MQVNRELGASEIRLGATLKKDKSQRQVDAQIDKMRLQLDRVYSISIALVHSQIFYQDFERERARLFGKPIDDDELLSAHLRTLRQVEVDSFARVEAYIGYFLATLYAACEKWREWKFADAGVDGLLASPHFELLEKHRHSVFHADHVNESLTLELVRDSEFARWSIDLAATMKGVLQDWHSNTEQRMREHLYRVY